MHYVNLGRVRAGADTDVKEVQNAIVALRPKGSKPQGERRADPRGAFEASAVTMTL